MTEISVESALDGFLTDRREHGSQRQYSTAEKVISSLRSSIGKDGGPPASQIPAGRITGHIVHLIGEVLPHEEFATVSELPVARRVLSSRGPGTPRRRSGERRDSGHLRAPR